MKTTADNTDILQRVETPPPVNCKWSFVIQTLNGRRLLYEINVFSHGTGEIILSNTKEKYRTEVLCYSRILWLLHVTHIVSVIVETAIAELVWCPCFPIQSTYSTVLYSPILTLNLKDDIELQQLPADAHLRNNSPNRVLTNAFRNPEILRDTPEFIARHYQRLVKRSSSGCITALLSTNQTSIIVLKQVINRWCIFWILFGFLCASPVVGIIVGLCSGRADVGMNMSMAILALIPAVIALAVWVTAEP